jgi:hypothetical protein
MRVILANVIASGALSSVGQTGGKQSPLFLREIASSLRSSQNNVSLYDFLLDNSPDDQKR